MRASRASADHRHFSWTSDLSASFFLFFASGGGEADKWKVAAPPAVVHDPANQETGIGLSKNNKRRALDLDSKIRQRNGNGSRITD